MVLPQTNDTEIALYDRQETISNLVRILPYLYDDKGLRLKV